MDRYGGIPKIFADYKSIDVSGNAIGTDNRKTRFKNSNNEMGVSKAILTDAEAASYTYDTVIVGNDQWNPRKFICTKPQVWK